MILFLEFEMLALNCSQNAFALGRYKNINFPSLVDASRYNTREKKVMNTKDIIENKHNYNTHRTHVKLLKSFRERLKEFVF